MSSDCCSEPQFVLNDIHGIARSSPAGDQVVRGAFAQGQALLLSRRRAALNLSRSRLRKLAASRYRAP